MPAHILGAIASGAVFGMVLGLLGSGGSILALPLLVFLAGYDGDAHLALGTTALAVAATAFVNFLHHARARNVRMREGLTLALPGVAGALAGSTLGLATPGAVLFLAFGALMLVAAFAMWRGPPQREATEPPRSAIALGLAGALVGFASGYFGIGGGFLVVPALVFVGGLGTRHAIGTSLLAVTAFGLSTAGRYALAGSIDLPVAGVLFLGGLLGGIVGSRLHHSIAPEKLRRGFSIALVAVAAIILGRGIA